MNKEKYGKDKKKLEEKIEEERDKLWGNEILNEKAVIIIHFPSDTPRWNKKKWIECMEKQKLFSLIPKNYLLKIKNKGASFTVIQPFEIEYDAPLVPIFEMYLKLGKMGYVKKAELKPLKKKYLLIVELIKEIEKYGKNRQNH